MSKRGKRTEEPAAAPAPPHSDVVELSELGSLLTVIDIRIVAWETGAATHVSELKINPSHVRGPALKDALIPLVDGVATKLASDISQFISGEAEPPDALPLTPEIEEFARPPGRQARAARAPIVKMDGRGGKA